MIVKSNCFITEIHFYRSLIEIYWHNRISDDFGCIEINCNDGKLIIDSEGMDRNFVKSILNQIVDEARFIGESDE